METVRKPVFHVDYGHRDITAWLTPFCLSVTYTDHLTGQSDGLEIQVEDRGGRWSGKWYPVKGDDLSLAIGYDGEKLLPCGTFQVDEIELSGPPDVVTIRALAAGVRQALRTKTSRALEGVSLRQVAERIAGDHGLRVEGAVPDLTFRRMTQNRETDLGFLKRVAHEHGVVFSVRGERLVFHQLEDLEAQPAALKVERHFLKAFSLRDKTHEVHAGAESQYFDPETKQVVEHTIKAQGKRPGDVLRLRRRAESSAHAQRQAKAALRLSKGWEMAGTITLPGEPRIMAGVNLELGESFGGLSGLYQVTGARHSLSRSEGYTTEAEIRRV